MKFIKKGFLFLILIYFSSQSIMAQKSVNYDESKVPALSLPDLFVSFDGSIIDNSDSWEKIRRPELIGLFAENVYGQLPKDFDAVSFDIIKEKENPLAATTQMKQVKIKVERAGNAHSMNLFVFFPKEIKEPLPVFLLISHRPVNELLEKGNDGFFPIEQIVGRGYVTAVFDVEDVSPDDPDRFRDGILSRLYPDQLNMPDGMRGLGAWSWGAMRAMDYFETDTQIDKRKTVVVGHSRGGKAALWVGANDTRWKVTVSNESGCGGAALSKRKFGETIELINTGFPYWFADNFKSFDGKEESMPFDQHQLIATIAPRSVYVASALEDKWADPKGEFLSLKLGSRVYQEIYGLDSSFTEDFRNEVTTLHKTFIGYHLREGEHDLTPEDWGKFMDFADLQFGKSGLESQQLKQLKE